MVALHLGATTAIEALPVPPCHLRYAAKATKAIARGLCNQVVQTVHAEPHTERRGFPRDCAHSGCAESKRSRARVLRSRLSAPSTPRSPVLQRGERMHLQPSALSVARFERSAGGNEPGRDRLQPETHAERAARFQWTGCASLGLSCIDHGAEFDKLGLQKESFLSNKPAIVPALGITMEVRT